MDLKADILSDLGRAHRPISLQEVTIDLWYPIRMEAQGGPEAMLPVVGQVLSELVREGKVEASTIEGDQHFSLAGLTSSAPSPAARAPRKSSKVKRQTTNLRLEK